MPKNILVFSDGTGNAGGITFDEDRTNIYKLYRATRCGPDTIIKPSQQVAFYDPGLGSPADGSSLHFNLGRRIYNLASQATGLGLTENIIDCYAAIIRLYRDGDRIFLFGFSRGAYTSRCLGAVIALCGIPRRMPNGSSIPLDIKGSRDLASKAVKDVYQFYPTKARTKGRSYRNYMLDTRTAIAKRFREEHASNTIDEAGVDKANVYPYFIGVFDTVAALGSVKATVGFIVAALVVLGVAIPTISGVATAFANAPYVGWFLEKLSVNNLAIFAALAVAAFALPKLIDNYLKYDFRVPGYGFWKSLATIHIAEPKQRFYDNTLNPNVCYAKHAISIDENRGEFERVVWEFTGKRAGIRDSEENIYFEQVWFPGVHADIGGGYSENESRLSDIALGWMTAAAAIIPNGISYDGRVLNISADAVGMQHDEFRSRRGWTFGIRELPNLKATVHKSVYARFKAKAGVQQFDRYAPYRPATLRDHVDFKQYFDTSVTDPKPAGDDAQSRADDIEYKWGLRQEVPKA